MHRLAFAFVVLDADYELRLRAFLSFLFVTLGTFRGKEDGSVLADKEFPAAAVYGESGFYDHLSGIVVIGHHIETADDSPAKDHPADEPPLLVEVALLREKVTDGHHLAIVVVVALEIRNIASAACSLLLIAHDLSSLHRLIHMRRVSTPVFERRSALPDCSPGSKAITPVPRIESPPSVIGR